MSECVYCQVREATEHKAAEKEAERCVLGEEEVGGPVVGEQMTPSMQKPVCSNASLAHVSLRERKV